MTDTWTYRSETDPDGPVPIEWVWERLRNRRNALLAASDFRVLPDAPWPVEPWIIYREQLRDMTDITTDPRAAIWPTPPQG